jgi:hypothetical protein
MDAVLRESVRYGTGTSTGEILYKDLGSCRGRIEKKSQRDTAVEEYQDWIDVVESC